MAFDRKYYRTIKAFVAGQVSHRQWCQEVTPDSFQQHILGFLPLIADCVAREDYEAAKATRDALCEYLNEQCGMNIGADELLALPELRR